RENWREIHAQCTSQHNIPSLARRYLRHSSPLSPSFWLFFLPSLPFLLCFASSFCPHCLNCRNNLPNSRIIVHLQHVLSNLNHSLVSILLLLFLFSYLMLKPLHRTCKIIKTSNYRR